ncbi:MAG: integration host factor subunit beta [Candidatus Marinimicrobia bacterium]|nr:integration host factor subunit beta [Candidatus Neomarinimicrobiota bacterium]|tara:strand:- start:360 stop:653 length:294 start_codon:yes stop_codon:yes gene_type:complete
MTKADIVNEVSSATGLTKVETEAVLEGIINSIASSLKKNKRVDIRGFGSFVVKKRNAREARNPATNEKVILKERFVPSFKVSKILKKEVNQSLLRGF